MNNSSPQKHHIDDVYGVARDLPENYVVRDQVDGAFVEALARNQHIVIHGSSKQGKTSLRKYTLEERDYAYVMCSNQWNLGQLHAAILKAVGYSVEVSRTQAVSGEFKINAKLQASVKLGPLSVGGEVGGDGGETKTTTTETRQLELDPADVNDVITALDAAESPKFIVLEDFHYLSDETQRDFSVALKAFHENSPYTFVVVGVWLDSNRLVQHNGDLTGRVISINADQWTADELRQAIQDGAELLNIQFDETFVEELVSGSFESVWIVQETCRLACSRAGVFETQESTRLVEGDAQALIKEVVEAHSARYIGFIINFAVGFVTTTLEMYRWLLFPILSSDVSDLERGIAYGELRAALDAHHPERPINAGNLTQALQATAALQVGRMRLKPIILDYDQTYRRLNVVDRSFLIWLQYQDRDALLADAGLPTSSTSITPPTVPNDADLSETSARNEVRSTSAPAEAFCPTCGLKLSGAGTCDYC